MNDEKLVGKLILQIRLDNHLSQEAFAEKIGVSRQTVYNWEADISQPGFDKIMEICSVFQLPMSIFLKEECAISQSTSVENVHNEEEQANCDQKFSHRKKRIALFSAILISVIITSSIMLTIWGIIAFPLDRDSHLAHIEDSVWYFSSGSIFWIVFSCSILIIAIFTFLIVRLVIKNKKRTRTANEDTLQKQNFGKIKE